MLTDTADACGLRRVVDVPVVWVAPPGQSDSLDAFVVRPATGFRGPLNYYRNLDRNWELMAAFADVTVKVPALFIAGDHDMVMAAPPGMDQQLANLRQFVTTLRDVRILPGCGHWTQQERPSEVNAALLDFIRNLPG